MWQLLTVLAFTLVEYVQCRPVPTGHVNSEVPICHNGWHMSFELLLQFLPWLSMLFIMLWVPIYSWLGTEATLRAAESLANRKRKQFEEAEALLNSWEQKDEYNSAKTAKFSGSALTSEQEQLLLTYKSIETAHTEAARESTDAERRLIDLKSALKKYEAPVAMIASGSNDANNLCIQRLKHYDQKWINARGKEDKSLANQHKREEEHYTILQKISLKLTGKGIPTSSAHEDIREKCVEDPNVFLDDCQEVIDLVKQGNLLLVCSPYAFAQHTCDMFNL